MCGIAGIVKRGSGVLGEGDRLQLEKMLRALGHRGPDGSGTWVSADRRVMLGHRRLAIVELSPAGHEPITSADGRVTLTFNGEIFNHAELRPSVPSATSFRGRCDAETLAEVLAARGRAAIDELRGFFAFAAAMPAGEVLLVRDRLGEKPLYFADDGTRTVFASEVRALLASGAVERRLDPDAVALYLGIGSVPHPRSIIAGVRALPPASFVTIGDDGPSTPEIWWTPPVPEPTGRRIDEEQVADEAEALLRSSIADRLLADVPVGAFLSGGVDSPLIVALMQQATRRPVHTFTVGFEHSGATPDERRAARDIATALGSDHCEHTITRAELPATAERFFDALDQPSGDAFNSFLASEAVGGTAKAVLSGVGADELFYGYGFAHRAARLGRIGAAARSAPLGDRARMTSLLGGPQRLGVGGRLARAATALCQPAHVRLLLTQRERRRLGCAAARAEAWLSDGSSGPDPARQADVRAFLQVVLLPDLDAMTMAHSLEARAPYLDHRLVEWALALPPQACWSGRSTKAPLRRLAARHVPGVPAGPKLGFDLPLAAWMAGPLRRATDDLTSASAARGLIDGGELARLVAQVRAGRRHPRSAWHLLVLEAWLARHAPDAGS